MLDYTGDELSVVSLLYQTGYLTIIGYDAEDQEYTLAFPNKEVKYGFLESMLPEYIPDCVSGSGLDIFTLRRYVKEGNLDQIRNVLTALFARIPYTVADSSFEHYFQTVIYLIFTLLGKYALCEMHTLGFSKSVYHLILTREHSPIGMQSNADGYTVYTYAYTYANGFLFWAH